MCVVSHGVRTNIPAGMWSRHPAIGSPKTRASTPRARRCAATESPNGPAPTTATSASRGAIAVPRTRPRVPYGAPQAAQREDAVRREPAGKPRPAVELARHRDDHARRADEAALELTEAGLAGLAPEVVPADAETREPADDPPLENIAGAKRERRRVARTEDVEGGVAAHRDDRARDRRAAVEREDEARAH